MDVCALARGICADDFEVLGATHIAMSSSSRKNQAIARLYVEHPTIGPADKKFRRSLRHAQNLVRESVVVLIIEYAIGPYPRPTVAGEYVRKVMGEVWSRVKQNGKPEIVFGTQSLG